MPQGKGTYGSQVGRPPKKKAEGEEMEDQMEGLAISVEPVTVKKDIEDQMDDLAIEKEQLPDEEMLSLIHI